MSRRPAGAALAVLVAVLLAACGNDAAPAGVASPAPPALTAPLQTSFSAGGAGDAVVAMGLLDQPLDTFWQLVTRPAGSSRWTLVTPPGVADNGGLVVAGEGRQLTVAFLPSQDLTFSPLSTSSDGGRTWTAGGLVPSALAAVPDALAGAAGGTLLALLPSARILSGTSTGASWPQVAGFGPVAGRACVPSGLTALAVSDSAALAGAACSRPVAGVFVRRGTGGWLPADVPLPPALTTGPTAVLRLAGVSGGARGAGGVAGLVAGGGTRPALAAIWSPAGVGGAGAWRVSPALSLGGGAAIVATGFGPGLQEVVVWRGRGAGVRAATIAGPGSSWVMLPAPPAGTQAIAVEPAGVTEALAVAGSTLMVWRLRPPAAAWREVQQIEVPLQLGSSS